MCTMRQLCQFLSHFESHACENFTARLGFKFLSSKREITQTYQASQVRLNEPHMGPAQENMRWQSGTADGTLLTG